MELFKILEFTGTRYSVSSYGRIRNEKTNACFLPSYSGDKYRRFTFQRKKYRVHRLVARAFIPNPKNLPQVRHINSTNEGKLDNMVTNLKWCSSRENALARKNVVLQTDRGFHATVWIRGTRIQLKAAESEEIADHECSELKRIFSE